MKTRTRVYVLFAPNLEERDLWVNSFFRVMGIPVADPTFVPMGKISKASLNLHQQVAFTDGNNTDDGQHNQKQLDTSRSSHASQREEMPTVEEKKQEASSKLKINEDIKISVSVVVP